MSEIINTYTFLPWLRQGLANNIDAQDDDAAVKLRASVEVAVSITGTGISSTPITPEPVRKNVSLYGPGDIIGIESRAIVKVEPRNWITNFEPNYLPYIEFYDEDFAWRYTPAAPDPDKHQLRPWIMLVVLKEDEFENGSNIVGKPLPYFTLKANVADVFPDATQLWAWAHVHINKDIVQDANKTKTSNTANILPRVNDVINNTPDSAYCRIMCPRQLEANAAYHAFVIPVFESGRLAGLGLDPDASPAEVYATFSAWGSYTNKEAPLDFPYYHRWYFRTGTVGDFEYLVRLLEPKPVDVRVGRRDIDVQKPMVNMTGITDPELGGIIRLGGALQPPMDGLSQEDKDEINKYDNWAINYPHEFQTRLAGFLNLADDYSKQSSAQANAQANTQSNLDAVIDPQTNAVDPDPLITPPIYGRWHAMVQRVLNDRNSNPLPNNTNWVNDLNLDPRWRVAAGFGTKVIQNKQEEYMDAAWGQVGDIIEANRRMRQAELAKRASLVWYRDHVLTLRQDNPQSALLLTTPIHKRILSTPALTQSAKTVFYQFKTSPVPNAAVSPTMRRMTRPRGRLIKAMEFNEDIRPDNLLTRINDEQVFPAPPKPLPVNIPTLEDLSHDARPSNIPQFLLDCLAKCPWIVYLPILIIIVVLLMFMATGFDPLAWTNTLTVIGACFAVMGWLWYLRNNVQRADSILPQHQTPAAVDDLPVSSDFHISLPSSGFIASTGGGSDSVEAARYKDALRDNYELVETSIAAAYQAPPIALNLSQLATDVVASINPAHTLPIHVGAGIVLPDRIRVEQVETFKPPLAYPEIDIPMYKPLIDMSSDNFLPNINLIGQNTISLLETNQKFIESYMVGLNHEFARELLWREYPTDQRGSYFRQFWDVSSVLNTENLSAEALREKLRDIPPLHQWSKTSDLGDHDHREAGRDNEEELVLVIRGELLKKYPTAVIYAHRAKWIPKDDGSIDNTQPRDLDESEPIEGKILTPLYEAKVDPDIYFFGFDLTTLEAKGGTGENPDDDPGWFFVIKERPGEPRFGLDIERDGDLLQWNDLAWPDVMNGGNFINADRTGKALSINATTDSDTEVTQQRLEDSRVKWDGSSNAAELAYILYQVPVLVAVHASEMLPK